MSVLGGSDPFGNPLMNLDVRVGNTSNVGFDVNSKITNNIRLKQQSSIDMQIMYQVSQNQRLLVISFFFTGVFFWVILNIVKPKA